MKLSLGSLFSWKKDRKVQAFFEKEFHRMSDFLPEDIFIAGYPKSGNTWFQELVAGIAFGVLSDKTLPKLVNDLVPDVHCNPVYRRYQTPTFFKTHHSPRPEYQNVVYLLRDGRDVMVSYWHHRRNLERKEVNFLDMVQNGEGLFPCKWHEHVTEWMANPYKARMITIKYKDLLARPVPELERFCTFSGIEIDRPYLEMVVESASFKKLQNRERHLGDVNSRWPKDKPFFRRGVTGSYRDEMPKDVLNAFMAEAKETLEKHGYC